MKRTVLLAVVIVGLIGIVATAQCGCTPLLEGEGPTCYTTYWAGVDIAFKLVVPAEYFSQNPVPTTPLITGWRVETLEGTIVYQEQFPDVPKGHYLEMVWDQRDTWCNRVPPGYYRLVVQRHRPVSSRTTCRSCQGLVIGIGAAAAVHSLIPVLAVPPTILIF